MATLAVWFRKGQRAVRLGLSWAAAPESGWSNLLYQVTLRGGALFILPKDVGGVALEDGIAFRVRAIKPTGEEERLVSTFVESGGGRIVARGRHSYGVVLGESRAVAPRVAAGQNLLHDHGYWAVPPLVVGDSSGPRGIRWNSRSGV